MNGSEKICSFAELYILFKQRCAVKGIKDSTMGFYVGTIGRFVRWADDRGITPEELTPLNMIEYTGNLKRLDGEFYKQNSLRAHCRDLKTLLNFAADVKVIPEKIKIEMPKKPEDEIKALNDEELESVLEYFDNSADVNPRDAAVVYLLKDTGIRAGELLALTWEDFEWDADRHLGTVSVTKQVIKSSGKIGSPKNGKSRKSYFNSDTWEHLEALKKSVGGVPPPELLFSQRDTFLAGMTEPTSRVIRKYEGKREPLKHGGLGYMLRTAGERLSIYLTPHLFRHTAGRLMTIAGMPPVAIMQILGHSSLDMVTRYSLLWGGDVADLFVDKMNGNH